MRKKEGQRSRQEAVFDNPKIQKAYQDLNRVVEKKKIDVMKLFL